jgi:hypothetical protein
LLLRLDIQVHVRFYCTEVTSGGAVLVAGDFEEAWLALFLAAIGRVGWCREQLEGIENRVQPGMQFSRREVPAKIPGCPLRARRARRARRHDGTTGRLTVTPASSPAGVACRAEATEYPEPHRFSGRVRKRPAPVESPLCVYSCSNSSSLSPTFPLAFGRLTKMSPRVTERFSSSPA